MHPPQLPPGDRSQATHQASTVYGNAGHSMQGGSSQGYPLPSQPLQLYQQPSHQQLGLPATHASQVGAQPPLQQSAAPAYQPDTIKPSWHGSAAQQPVPYQAPPQVQNSTAPQSAYAQPQQPPYPAMLHAHPHTHSQGMASTTTRVPAQQSLPLERMPNPHLTAPMPGQPPAVPAAASAAPSGRGFTQSQLNVLRNQILAFRRIKRGDKILPADLMQSIKAPPADGTFVPAQAAALSQAPARPMLQPALPTGQVAPRVLPQPQASQGALVGQARPQMATQYIPQQPAPVLEMQAPLGKHRGPIYMAVSAPRGAPFVPQRPQMGQLPLMQMGYDAAQLMAQEYRSMTLRRRLARIADLEAQLAADPMPGFDQVDGKMGKGKLLLELRMLRLADVQAKLRAAVEKEQEDVQVMSDRNYRKFVRNCLRQRIEIIKQEERKKADVAAERSRMIKLFRSTLQERSNYSRESRLARNRQVSKIHERLARDAHKALDDDKGRRMDALKAHDWQAYQELLAKQKGPEGASERYEVINRFLDDTENYLHKLAGKVANVKLSQEASEAAAQAMAEARAQASLTVYLYGGLLA
ncbi:hypothetical protein ABBQ32_009578 [Trebouxia sp. C0010 RCD-2024]